LLTNMIAFVSITNRHTRTIIPTGLTLQNYGHLISSSVIFRKFSVQFRAADEVYYFLCVLNVRLCLVYPIAY